MKTKLFTKEQVRAYIKENNINSIEAIEDAVIAPFKDFLQEALEAELDHELGYSRYNWKNKEGTNSRNGHSKKKVISKHGAMEIQVPRDTEGKFEPQIVKKHERRLNPSIDDRIISMYAKGMTTRDINSHMKQIYGINVSADMVSQITDKVLPLAREWQNRPLEEMYPILFLDGIIFKVQQDGQVTKKTVYVVYALTVEGKKDVLGIWIGGAESAKFWMKVLADLKNRGVQDILIASVDGCFVLTSSLFTEQPMKRLPLRLWTSLKKNGAKSILMPSRAGGQTGVILPHSLNIRRIYVRLSTPPTRLRISIVH